MTALPVEFSNLGLDPSQYRMGDRKSLRGPCISCGGHNRMVMFVDHPFPKWWLRCDLCGVEGWIDQFFGNLSGPGFSPAKDIEIASDTFVKEVEARLKQFQNTIDYEQYHNNMTEENRAWWRDQGIPNEWQDFWKLGFRKDMTIKVRDTYYTKDAYSIPKFGMGWEIKNIDYRIIDPPLGAGKYRPTFGIPAALFIARPDIEEISEDGTVIVVEGSKKAMVTCIYLGMQVIGVPAARSWAGVEDLVQNMDRVITVLDPDAEKAAWKLASTIGRNSIQLMIPEKIDDAFANGWLTEDDFWKIFKLSGRRVYA